MKKYILIGILLLFIGVISASSQMSFEGISVDRGMYERVDPNASSFGTTTTWMYATTLTGGASTTRARSNLTAYVIAKAGYRNNGLLNDVYGMGSYARIEPDSDAAGFAYFGDVAIGDPMSQGVGMEIALRNWTGQEAPNPNELRSGGLYGVKAIAYAGGGIGSSKATAGYTVEAMGKDWAFNTGLWFGPDSIADGKPAIDIRRLGYKVDAMRLSPGQKIYWGESYLFSDGVDLFWNGRKITGS